MNAGIARNPAGTFALHGALLFIGALFFAPILLMLLTSLKSSDEIVNGSIIALPEAPSLAAWSKAWGSACISGTCEGISRGFANSIAIVLPAVTLCLVLGGLTGYAMNLRASRHADLLLKAILVGLFIPIQATMFPMIILVRELGLFGTRAGAVLVHVLWGLPFVTLLFRNHFLTISRNIIHAARIDGAGFFSILWHIVLPMSWPIFMVAAALQFTFLWNEYLLSLTFAGTGNEPVTVALSILSGAQFGVPEYNVNIAATVLTALPTVAIYLLYGKIFLRGVTTGVTRTRS
jgi:glucose/mannose transport system permease protein